MDREAQIEALRPWMSRGEKVYEWPEAEAEAYRAAGGFTQGRHDAETARIEGLLDGPVATMVAEAERRGAVKALRSVGESVKADLVESGQFGITGNRGDAIEAGDRS